MKNRIKVGLIALCIMSLAFVDVRAQKYENTIDKTVAVIGNSVITLSQLEMAARSMQSEGYESNRRLRCDVLENMLVSKLFYTQALIDSLSVNPDMVNASVDSYLDQWVTRFGSVEAMESYFGKSMNKIKQDQYQRFLEQNLAQEMQRTIAGKVQDVTPREVERYARRTPKDSLPIIPIQYKISQIVLYPDVERAKMDARERLLEFRERIMNGTKFSLLATMYSDDSDLAMRGGELGMASKNMFWPEFADAAMALNPGQVSSIVETPDGFHLIQMIEKKGDMFNARHILLKPRYTEEDMIAAFTKLDSLKALILADSLSFEEAARLHSQDAMSRTNGGLVADSYTGSAYFEVDRMKPADYKGVQNLKPGEISMPIESQDDEGRGNTIYKIIRLEDVKPAHTADFDGDFNTLAEITKNRKMQDAIDKFIAEKQASTYIVIDPMFQGCDFQRKGWIK